MAGKYFEEFAVGQVFKHQPGRTVTEMDNVLFTCLTMNPQPLHLDEEFAKQTEFGHFTQQFDVSLTIGCVKWKAKPIEGLLLNASYPSPYRPARPSHTKRAVKV